MGNPDYRTHAAMTNNERTWTNGTPIIRATTAGISTIARFVDLTSLLFSFIGLAPSRAWYAGALFQRV